jgi:hypothetical protein
MLVVRTRPLIKDFRPSFPVGEVKFFIVEMVLW